MSCLVSLITAGIGYLVFLQASKERGVMRLLGLGIGFFLIGAGVLSLMCPNMCSMKSACDMKKGGMCPVSLKAPEAVAK